MKWLQADMLIIWLAAAMCTLQVLVVLSIFTPYVPGNILKTD